MSNKHRKISGGFQVAHESWKGWILIDDDDENQLICLWYFKSRITKICFCYRGVQIWGTRSPRQLNFIWWDIIFVGRWYVTFLAPRILRWLLDLENLWSLLLVYHMITWFFIEFHQKICPIYLKLLCTERHFFKQHWAQQFYHAESLQLQGHFLTACGAQDNDKKCSIYWHPQTHSQFIHWIVTVT